MIYICVALVVLGVVFVMKLTFKHRKYFVHYRLSGISGGGADSLSDSVSSKPQPSRKPTVLPVKDKVVPVSVNYHFTRKCNYKCGFCFHTAKTSFVLPLDAAKTGLRMLKAAGKYLKWFHFLSRFPLCKITGTRNSIKKKVPTLYIKKQW